MLSGHTSLGKGTMLGRRTSHGKGTMLGRRNSLSKRASPAIGARRVKQTTLAKRTALSSHTSPGKRLHRPCQPRGNGTLRHHARGRVARSNRGLLFAAERNARHYSSTLRIAMKASCGTSTEPMAFMRFLPSFCFSSSLRLREMSPP